MNYEEEKALKAKAIRDARKKFAEVTTELLLFTSVTAQFFPDKREPDGWSESVGTLQFKDSVTLDIRLEFNVSRHSAETRAVIRTEHKNQFLPYGFLEGRTTRITVNPSRSAEAIARDIGRRLFPDAFAIHEAEVKGEKAHSDYETAMSAFVEEVMAATGEKERDLTHSKGVERGRNDCRHEITGWLNGYYVKIRTRHEERTVDFVSLEGVPFEVAKKIFKLLQSVKRGEERKSEDYQRGERAGY